MIHDIMWPTAIVVVDFALCVLLWVVQAIIYPSFRYADPATFVQWHQRYMSRITLFVWPLMMVQLAYYTYATMTRFNAMNLIAVLLAASAWAVTFLWSVPCHRKLHMQGQSSAVLDSLLMSNLVRALAWTGVFVLSAYRAATA